jgi:Arc/MetJ-type ribon-helix-helix transcriptional regulator
MTITIELTPEVEQWVARKLEAGQFASPADFVNARLRQDWLEEKIEEAFLEPATPLTEQDWADARQRLEETISKKQ